MDVGERAIPQFRDRRAAGRVLAARLEENGWVPEGAVVLGLARGGVPVAYEVAETLAAPLDVLVVRKLGVPGQEELAMGAVASGGVVVTNDEVIAAAGIGREALERAIARESAELERRERLYRSGREPLEVAGRTVVVVDDGLATGSSMRAGIRALRQRDAAAVIAAIPVAPIETCEALAAEADQVVCAETPCPFGAVGSYYVDFTPTSDDEVRELLAERAGRGPA